MAPKKHHRSQFDVCYVTVAGLTSSGIWNINMDCDNSTVITLGIQFIINRDSNMENAKTLAELVDYKLEKHYELDDSGKKKVRHLLNKECWQDKQSLSLGSKWEPWSLVLFSSYSLTKVIVWKEKKKTLFFALSR